MMTTDRPTTPKNNSKGAARRCPIGAPLYKTSLHGIPEQALLHRICAELLSSSSDQRVVVLPHHHSTTRSVRSFSSSTNSTEDSRNSNKNEKDGEEEDHDTYLSTRTHSGHVLEILNGSLYIVDDDPILRSDASSSSSVMSTLSSYQHYYIKG
mmetsp:Transcript_17622/g.33131  ORF Transcript_17622/g.33131 Transcript_17622/m.33131 type:complete len:153 (-) Transcript_17622:126-584(-)